MTIPGISTGPRIWKRSARVKLNGKVVADHTKDPGHRIEFSVVRHNRVEPNTAEVRIFGLAIETRRAISAAFDKARELVLQAGGVGSVGDLELEAGYDGVVSLLTKADIQRIEHQRQHPGWVTTIQAADGVLPFQNSIVNESIAPGVDINLAKTIIAQSLKIAFLDADSETAFQEALGQFSSRMTAGGLVLQGPTRKVLTDLLDSMKLAWSYQDGRLVLLRFDGTKTDQAVLLGPKTGLQSVREKEFGRVVAMARLNPLLHPGRQVSLVDGNGAPQGAGVFRVDRVAHTGDTDTGPWESACELRPSQVQ